MAAFLAAITYNVVEILMDKYSFSSSIIIVITHFFAGIILASLIRDKWNFSPIFNRKKNLFLLVLSVLTTFSLASLAIFGSIKLIGSSKSSFVVLIEPLFIIILAAIFLKERISKKEVYGGVLMILGALLINFDFNYFKFVFGFGEFLAILAPFLFAIGIVATTDLLKRVKILELTSIELILGSIFMLITFSFLVEFNYNFSFFSIILLVIVVFAIASNWLFYNLGLKKVGASICSILYTSKAFFTLAISYLLMWILPSLGLKIPENTLTVVLGGFLIILGIIVIKNNSN